MEECPFVILTLCTCDAMLLWLQLLRMCDIASGTSMFVEVVL